MRNLAGLAGAIADHASSSFGSVKPQNAQPKRPERSSFLIDPVADLDASGVLASGGTTAREIIDLGAHLLEPHLLDVRALCWVPRFLTTPVVANMVVSEGDQRSCYCPLLPGLVVPLTL